MINTQPIEKRVICNDKLLSIVSIFKTIQGEGPFTGQRAIFVRLAGCNLQCPRCDTDYTSNRKNYHNSEVVHAIAEIDPSVKLVVITGGEPFRQYLTPVANTLICLGYTVQIETNGTLPPSKGLHGDAYIVCSPKAGKLNKDIAIRANAFKYVMDHNSVDEDGLPVFALDHRASPRVARPPKNFQGPIYLQPMDGYNNIVNKMNIRAVKKSCMENGYILQLQIHKLIGVE